MATRRISIDLEAYERLRNARREGESFSQVIRRLIPRSVDLERWFARIDANPLTPASVRALEETILSRSRVSRAAR